MDLRRAHVRFKVENAGVLEETPQGGSVFTYLEGWSETIACALPVHKRQVSWSPGLHPVFQNLGAEGWLREQQARAGRLEEEDDLGLLLRYGEDCIGAISIVSVDDGQHVAEPQFNDNLAEAATGARRTISGVQKKLLAWLDGDKYQAATDTSPATYIAKYAPDTKPDLLRNEIFTLSLAQEILGADEVTRFERGNVEGIEGYALLVERFDRTPDGGRLRMEDFAQILLKPRGLNFRGKYESSYEEVAVAISQHSSRPQIDLSRFFTAVVFNLLIGNADSHLKNWSLLERPDGLRLAPQYDLLNTLIYGGEYDTRTALAICGDKVRLDHVDWLLVEGFGTAIGLKPQAIAFSLNGLKKKFAKTDRLTPPPAEDPDGFVHRYVDVVRNACARVLEP
ncbi:MAG: HipA domain-containing protein [Rhodospirillales bacterium]|nr:HipA domain-containing protein [Rhodospirillales bacterium]